MQRSPPPINPTFCPGLSGMFSSDCKMIPDRSCNLYVQLLSRNNQFPVGFLPYRTSFLCHAAKSADLPPPPAPPRTKTHNPQMPRENIASTNNTHLKITQTKQSQPCLSLVFWIPERVPLLKVICHAALGSHSNTHMPTFHAFLFLLFIRLEINLHLAALINNAWLKKEGKVSQKP